MRAIASRVIATALDVMLGEFPRTIRVETTNACNAKCIICPHGEMDRVTGIMTDELFHKIAAECAAARVDTLHLHNFGEPLVDKKLPERIALCKSLGIRRVKIISNGSLLTEDRARALIDAGLDEIKISFDGANKEEFERIRAPLKYEAVVGNVIGLARIRNEKGAKLKINVTCSSTTDKDATMSALEKHVDGFTFASIHNWADWESDTVAEGARHSRTRKPCARVWQTFTILADGRVSLCCLDYDGRVVLGNLSEDGQTIRGIWKNQAYAEIRRRHREGRQGEIAICAGCSKAFW
jgi:MoaA/NifB/PqqE/SkfB family radical SAM enzyme